MLGNRLTPVVKILLIANVAIFLLASMTNYEKWIDFMALRYFTSPDFNIYQIITHMFMHGGLGHLFSNMFALFMFGPALEHVWGAKRFLIFYLICGIGGALFYTGVNTFEFKNTLNKIEVYNSNPNPYDFELIVSREFKNYYDASDAFYQAYEKAPDNPEYIRSSKEALKTLYNNKVSTPMIGASGAVFGILLAFGMLFPNTELMLLFPPIPIKAKYFVAIYGLIELYAGVHRSTGDTVAHFAHIGGMVFAYFMIIYWKRRRDSFY